MILMFNIITFVTILVQNAAKSISVNSFFPGTL